MSLLVLAACAPDPGEADACPRVGAIVAGTTDPPPGLGPAAYSVLAIRVQDDRGHDLQHCTGVRLDDRRILTAAHCFESDGPVSIRLQDGAAIEPASDCTADPSSDPSSDAAQVMSVHVHPTRDVALLVTSPSPQPSVTICAVPPQAGDAAIAAGFGLDENAQIGTRRYLSVAVAATSDEALDARASSAAGTCVGDSGGPLFIPGDGTACLAGTLTTGSADCRGLERYVPSAALVDWLAGL
jgi:hypothetical protein